MYSSEGFLRLYIKKLRMGKVKCAILFAALCRKQIWRDFRVYGHLKDCIIKGGG